jgi:F420-dependent oxidoreductase-like protein
VSRLPLAFSVYPGRKLPIDAVVRLTQHAERLGYDSVWIPETWGVDAVSVLATLAVQTETIRLASGVLNVYSRSIALIAQTAATLQTLSGGRFILGLGVSGPTVVEHWHGVPFDRPLDRTRHAVAGIRALLQGTRMDMATQRADNAGFALANVPDTPPPIYLAAIGPRNVHLGGQIADGWLPIFVTRREDLLAMERFRAGARQAGRDPDELQVAAFIPTALGSGGDAALRQHLAYYIGGMGTFYAEHARRLGYAREVDAIRTAWSEGRRREAVSAVPEALLADVTIGTTRTEAQRRLHDFRAGGMTIPVLSFPHGLREDEIASALAELAPVAASGG